MDHIVYLLTEYKYLILFPLAIVEGPIIAVIAGFLCSSGFLNPPATSSADSWKRVRTSHPPGGGGNDERGKSPKPRTGFSSLLESASPALPTFPPYGYCDCPHVPLCTAKAWTAVPCSVSATSPAGNGLLK